MHGRNNILVCLGGGRGRGKGLLGAEIWSGGN